MKKFLLPAVFALFLTACGPVTLTYTVDFTTENPDRMADLTLSLQRVVERRLARLEGALLNYDVDYDKETTTTRITVKVDNAASAKVLNEELTAPFDFEIRYLTEDKAEGDIVVEGGGSYRTTGITKEDIDWVLGETGDEVLKKGRVIIGFTDTGVGKMQQVFRDQAGNSIGLFVRGRLAASMALNEGMQFERVIDIPGLPSPDLAKVFADDMNVGIHMTFHPVEQ